MSAYLLTHSYWRNAQKARDPEHAMNAQAMLWGIAMSETAPDRIRQAAARHLSTIGEHPEELGNVRVLRRDFVAGRTSAPSVNPAAQVTTL